MVRLGRNLTSDVTMIAFPCILARPCWLSKWCTSPSDRRLVVIFLGSEWLKSKAVRTAAWKQACKRRSSACIARSAHLHAARDGSGPRAGRYPWRPRCRPLYASRGSCEREKESWGERERGEREIKYGIVGIEYGIEITRV